MKAIKCEMCDSSDIVKEGDYYVCQYCGTKYTVEAAKKLLVEGIVKIDNSDNVKKYLQNARQSKQRDDWGETEKYYNLVKENDPDNFEAVFYSAFARARISLIKAKINERKEIFNVLLNYVLMISDKYNLYKAEDSAFIKMIGEDITKLYKSNFVYDTFTDYSGKVVSSNKAETLNLFVKVDLRFCEAIEKLLDKMENAQISQVECWYQILLEHYNYLRDRYSAPVSHTKIKELHVRWNKMDPSHKIPKFGCYVATCVYGSYDCPQVWTLRRYRDDTLGSTWYGRAFIRVYYAISPTLVKWFGKTKWFKKMWQGKLDRMVKKLNAEGVENTPYIDKQW